MFFRGETSHTVRGGSARAPILSRNGRWWDWSDAPARSRFPPPPDENPTNLVIWGGDAADRSLELRQRSAAGVFTLALAPVVVALLTSSRWQATMINADADGRAAMYTTERCSEDVWRQRQSTVAADNSIDSRRGWQSTVVAVGGGGGQQGQMSGVDG